MASPTLAIYHADNSPLYPSIWYKPDTALTNPFLCDTVDMPEAYTMMMVYRSLQPDTILKLWMLEPDTTSTFVDIDGDVYDELQWQCVDDSLVWHITMHCDSNILLPVLAKDHPNLDNRVSGIYFYHPDHLGSAAWITHGNKAVQFIHYMPFGEMWYNQQGSAYNERFKFTGKERDEESGYDYFGARYYISLLGHWMSVDPLADKYPGISPYAYCGWNPIKFIDPDGCTIEGVESTDIRMFKHDVLRVLHDKKFKEFKSLLKIKNNYFQTISEEDVKNALSGKELSVDEQTYINILVRAINDKNHTFKIEYVGDEISDEGIDAIRKNCPAFSDLKQENSNLLVDKLGDGFSIPYGNGGSFCFVSTNRDCKTRSWLSHHELLGHGIPTAYGIFGDDNNSNAIRMENLVRRILGLPQTFGEGHQGVITNPTALPRITF